MTRVPVILVENRSIETKVMGLPRSDCGYEFRLEHLGWVQSKDAFNRHESYLARLNGSAILLLDLGLEEMLLGLEPAQLDFLKAKCPDGFEPLLPEQLPGLYLGLVALHNSQWTGLLVIASRNLNAPRRRKLTELLEAQPNYDVSIII